MKRTLLILAALAALLVISAVVLIGSAFIGRASIVDGFEIDGVRVIKDGFVSIGVIDLGDGGVALVDAGNDKAGEAILAELGRRKLLPEAVKAILLTHGHRDHIAGVGLFPQAEVMALRQEVDLAEGRVAAKGPIGRLSGAKPTGVKVTRALEDGETVSLGATQVRVFAVPGHTSGSCAYLVNGVLFMGDSADQSSDGKLKGAPWLFSESSEQNRISVAQLGRRLEAEGIDLKAVVFAHSAATLRGRALFAEFAAANPGFTASPEGEPAAINVDTKQVPVGGGGSVTCYQASSRASAPRGLAYYLQGSGYQSVEPQVGQLTLFARLGLLVIACDKRGVVAGGSQEQALRFATLDQRVTDTLTVLEHYRATSAPGLPVVLIAASEGGDVAARVAKALPAVTHAILIATGGGMSQADEFRMFINKRGEYLDMNSIADLDARLADIRTSGDDDHMWAGHPYRRWKSHLFEVPLDSWRVTKAALLVIHGDADEAAPVESARRLVAALREDKARSVQYVELAGADHELRLVKAGGSAVLQTLTEIGNWLVVQGLSSPEDRDALLASLRSPKPAEQP